MKLFLVALFVALVSSAPVEESIDPVEVIVHGLAEGEPLEIGDILEVKLKERVEGEVVASNDLLFPLTAEGLAEAAAAAQPDVSDGVQVIDEADNLPEAVHPEIPIVEEPGLAPEVVNPEVGPSEPILLPEIIPEVPGAGILPEIVSPDLVPESNPQTPEVANPLPVPAEEGPNGEIFNNGVVQVTVNTPEEQGVVATLQSWFSMVVNYFQGPEQISQQIV